MIRKVLLVSTACFMLAACSSDKISLASEAGGGGSSGQPGSNGSNGSNDSNGSDGGVLGSGGMLSNGLGVTGSGGTLSNILGTDLLGGVVDAALGSNNAISQILGGGSGDGSGGIVPQLATAVAGDPNATVLGEGLGISGPNGLIADLTGADLGGGLLGTQGVIPVGLAGGNDGLLGTLLGGPLGDAPLAPIVQALPTSTLTGALTQVPQLGVTGDGGVVDALLGVDLVGNLVGTTGGVTSVLAGGSSGAIGNQIPAGVAPLEPVGTAVVGLLDVVAGNATSPLANVTSALPGGSLPLANSPVGDLLGAVSGTSGGTTSSPVSGALAPVTSVVSTVVAPVSNTLGSVPVVGGLVTGLLGK